MRKKKDTWDFTTKEPLKDRQRKLWAIAEAIEIAVIEGKPLPTQVSKWLPLALKKIACGEDANEVFDVVGVKTERRDAFKSELHHKHAVGFVSSKTQQEDNKTSIESAVEIFNAAVPTKAASTLLKNYNSSSTDRKPIYSLTKK